jgi:hypothetical protein
MIAFSGVLFKGVSNSVADRLMNFFISVESVCQFVTVVHAWNSSLSLFQISGSITEHEPVESPRAMSFGAAFTELS